MMRSRIGEVGVLVPGVFAERHSMGGEWETQTCA